MTKHSSAPQNDSGWVDGVLQVLFYEDLAKVAEFVGKFPNYAEQFGHCTFAPAFPAILSDPPLYLPSLSFDHTLTHPSH